MKSLPDTTSANSRILSGIGWNSSVAATSQVLNFIRFTVVARLLLPDDIGLFAMATATMGAVTVFANFGLRQAFIAKKLESENELQTWLSTIWIGNILVRSGACLVIAAMAWPVTIYVGDPRLFPILLVICLTPVITALRNPWYDLQEKRAQFREIAKLEILGAVLSIAIAIPVVYFWRSPWALVLTYVGSISLTVAASYLLTTFRQRFDFRKQVFVEAFTFGRHLLVVGVLTFVTSQLDDIVVGGQLGVAALGLYAVAYRLAMLPAELTGTVVSRAVYPVYSELAEDRVRLRQTWSSVIRHLLWLIPVAMIPACIYGTELLVLVLGNQWFAAGTLLKLLIVAAIFRMLARSTSPLLLAIGRPDLDAKYKWISAIIFIPALFAGIAIIGLTGAALAGILSYAVAFLLRFAWAIRYLDLGRTMFAGIFMRPGIASLAVLLTWGMVSWLNQTMYITNLLLMVLVGMLLFAGFEPPVRNKVLAVVSLKSITVGRLGR